MLTYTYMFRPWRALLHFTRLNECTRYILHDSYKIKLMTSKAKAAPQSFQRQFAILLGATLETWAHCLLNSRHLYPRETFQSTRFLGVQCRACRHPGVVSYISDTVRVAVPSLLSGVADTFCMAITTAGDDDHDDDGEKVIERYTLRIVEIVKDWGENEDTTGVRMQEMERSMRDLVLSVLSLESERATASDSVSFLLTLHLTEENRDCTELNQAFANGTWFCPEQVSAASEGSVSGGAQRERIRPLHRVSTPSCVIDFAMRKIKDDRKAPPR